MPRIDDFSQDTKRRVIMRAGGRCSYPGCDVLCWIPGTEPSKVFTIGEVAHIHAASANGPRFLESQTSEERKKITNAIFLCQKHHHLIDQDENKYPSTLLTEFKQKHEEQILGESSGKWLLPQIEVNKNLGTIVRANKHQVIKGDNNDEIEHTITLTNISDFKYERIGFSVTFPEFIKDPIDEENPPGFNSNIFYSLKDLEVSTSGGGQATICEINYHDWIGFEGTSLFPKQSIKVRIKTKKDPYYASRENTTEKICFHISGSLSINLGGIYKEEFYTIPLFYEIENREVKSGIVHKTDKDSDIYTTLTRAYIVK